MHDFDDLIEANETHLLQHGITEENIEKTASRLSLSLRGYSKNTIMEHSRVMETLLWAINLEKLTPGMFNNILVVFGSIDAEVLAEALNIDQRCLEVV